MLADDGGSAVVAEFRRLRMRIAVGGGIEKGASEHVTGAIGVDGFDRGSRHFDGLPGFEHQTALGAARDADGSGQAGHHLPDLLKIPRAAPDLGFFLVAEQVIQATGEHGR